MRRTLPAHSRAVGALLSGLLAVMCGNLFLLSGLAGEPCPQTAPSLTSSPAGDPRCDNRVHLNGSLRSWRVHDDDHALRANPYTTRTPRYQLRCDTQQSANSLQVVYAHPRGQRDALIVGVARARIDTALAGANGVFVRSAAATGGHRKLRVVTTDDCRPAIRDLTAPADALRTFRTTIDALIADGLTSANRKYVVFTGPTLDGAYCGQATLDYDSQPGPGNASNSGPSYARVDCWNAVTVAHEIGHMLGAVQDDAPHATDYGHCFDVYDVMCYQDGPSTHLEYACLPKDADLLDCHHDDYFSTDPRPGSYLATHWNVANSSFLYGGGPAAPAEPTPGPPTVTARRQASVMRLSGSLR